MSGNFVGRRQTQKLWVELWVGVFKQLLSKSLKKLAGTTRLELATSAVTGQRSNQLNYVPSLLIRWETTTSVNHTRPVGNRHSEHSG